MSQFPPKSDHSNTSGQDAAYFRGLAVDLEGFINLLRNHEPDELSVKYWPDMLSAKSFLESLITEAIDKNNDRYHKNILMQVVGSWKTIMRSLDFYRNKNSYLEEDVDIRIYKAQVLIRDLQDLYKRTTD